MLRSVCRVQRVCCAGSTLQCGAGVGAGRQQKASGWKKGKVRGPSAAEENQRTNLYDLYLRCVEPPPREVYVAALRTGEWIRSVANGAAVPQCALRAAC